MIRRRIPPQYDFDPAAIIDAIKNTIPGVPFTIRGRVVTIDSSLTGQQVADLRAAIIPLLEEITDITV